MVPAQIFSPLERFLFLCAECHPLLSHFKELTVILAHMVPGAVATGCIRRQSIPQSPGRYRSRYRTDSIHTINSSLEVELHREFHVPRRADRSIDLAEVVGRRPIHTGGREAGMIGEVEELRTEIDVHLLFQTELLPKAKIPVGISGRFDNANPRVAERAGCSCAEGRRIQVTA